MTRAPVAYAAEVLPGLAPFAVAELKSLGARVTSIGEAEVRFEYGGPVRSLDSLRRCVSVLRILHYDIPRPKALLGHAQMARLAAFIAELRSESAVRDFDGFRLAAAGSDSPVFGRVARELALATGLAHSPEQGELLLRVLPAEGTGWDVLVRLTPRPLSARSWRVCNMQGGLNATVAAAVDDLLGAGAGDRYLNIMCGSGTLLIERGLRRSWGRGVGVDNSEMALACARANLEAAGLMARAELIEADARRLPFDSASFDRISADLPWGDAVGNHRANAELYPPLLDEAARVAAPRARMVVITHELKLLDAALAAQRAWQIEHSLRVFHGGHRPGVYLLRRR